MYTRTDVKMADAVTNGIELDSSKGAATAWAYMKYCKVPQLVILRVLAEPNLRRLSDINERLKGNGEQVDTPLIRLWRAPVA